jgi:trans-2,3-dihydro-3-hydroxyanthranilate isomerase
MGLPYLQTSVFVDPRYAFGGNQLATFWDAGANAGLASVQMQGMALEMHFSETTFVVRPTLKGCAWKVRIFTPASEVPFAGHPTLGTAFVLRHRQLISRIAKQATLELGIGAIPVKFLSADVVEMQQPQPKFLDEWQNRKSVAEAIGLTEADVPDASPVQFVSTGFPFLIVPVKSLASVRTAVPNPGRIMATLAGQPSRDILIFCAETVNRDSQVHARMFAPEVGILEDPATGSAAGPLAAYVERYECLPRHRKGAPIVIEQGYEVQRPSRLVAKVIGKEVAEAVQVSGQVKLVAEGKFYLEQATQGKRDIHEGSVERDCHC